MILSLAVVLCVGVGINVALIPVLETPVSDPKGLARPVLYTGKLNSSVSPYWADPEDLPINLPPTLCAANLTLPPKKCMKVFGPCDKQAKYRSVSGRCNNLQHPEYGTSGQFLLRLLPSAYNGEVMRLMSVSGRLLPNPRAVSLLTRGVALPSASLHNLLHMQMGQFIDHDYSITTVVRDHGKMMKCLECTSWTDPRCTPVPLPKDDPYIPAHINNTDKRRCLPVTRSVAKMWVNEMGAPELEQYNMNTAYLDLSQVYGNNECRGEELRYNIGGLLNTTLTGIPTQRPASHFPDCRDYSGWCFFSGDDRANENMGLTVLHFVFHREHNRLARALRIINPHWDDEKLYQEARAINIAQYQHSVYSQYLPAVIGYPTATRLQLLPQLDGYYLGYDEERNPEVYNSFSTAAFRFGHSSISDTLPLLDDHYHLVSSIPLVDTFQNTSLLLTAGVWESVVRGMLGYNMKQIDLHLRGQRLESTLQVCD
ncbi:chorion peroxidase [Procambarus clarkii]|uniref:chorion peroxidase n=1 Tax=Procambarus clarkii TaxID=6728 RepID=UPI0037430433